MSLTGNGLDVGSVFARAGLLFDDDGFDKFRRAIREVREDAKKDVRPNLEADFNARGFDQFDKALTGTRLEAGKDVKPDLGADFEGRGFDQFDRALRGARTDAARDVSTDLKADVDEAGFRKYDRALSSARRESDITTRAGIRTGAGFIGVGKSAGAAALGFIGTYGLVEGVKALYGAYRDSEKVSQQTEAVLRSTGEEAGVTADKVGSLAEKYSELAAVDDEAVQEGENFLLTFTNIRNEVGKGNNIFDQATLAVLNMSVALGQDMKSGSIQLGKALNDPIKGITALSRVGVAFDESTKKRIETYVEEGKTLQAQKIILRELNTEFGGSAKAAGKGASGMERLGIAVENAEEKIGSKLAPTLSKWSSAAADFVGSLTKGDIRMSKFGRTLDDFYHRHKSTFQAVGGAAKEFGRAVVVTVDRVGDAIAWLGPYWRRAFDAIAVFVKGWATLFKGAMKIISGILTGDLGRAVDGVRDIFAGLVGMIKGAVLAMLAPFRFVWDKVEGLLVQPIKDGIDKALGLLSSFIGTLGSVSDFASGIPGVGDAFDGVNDSIHDAQSSIDDFRESLRKTEGEQGNAIKTAKRHVDILKAERGQLRLNNASQDALRRNKQQLRRAQDDLTDATRKGGQSMQKSTGNAKGWGAQLRIVTGRTKEAKGGTDRLHGTLRDQGPSGVFAKGLKRLIRGSGNFQGALGRAVEFVKEATDKALKGFGAKPLDFVVQAVKDVGDLLGFARGGFIGKRGSKGADKRLVLAGDGEAFFNGDQIPYVEHALRRTFGVNLPQFFGGKKWRPHQQTRGYAEGGQVGNTTAMISEADRIDKLHIPYVWGGSHGQSPTPPNGPFDCSSAVSHILQVGGYGNPTMVSGQLAGFGAPGAGPVTIYANPEHTFMKLLGRFWGTSGSNPDGGPGWLEGGYPTGGFTVSHPTAASAGTVPKLKIKGPDGPYKTILQGAADKMVDGANAYVQKNAGFAGGDFNNPGGVMPQPQIEKLWRSVNPALGDAHLMSAIAMQESHGDTDIVGHDPGGTEGLGLWQITTGFNDGLIQSLGGREAMFDPETNAEAAASILRGSGLGAWVAYTSGDYAKFMAEGGIVDGFTAGGGGVGLQVFGKGGQVKGGGGGKGGGGKGSGPSIAPAEPSGPVHVSEMGPLEAHLGADGGKFVARQEGHLSDLEADYSYWERRFNLSEEEFIVEGKNGEPILNREAIKRRVTELKKLLSIRKAIIAVRNREIAFAKKTIELMRPVIKALKQGLGAAQSKEAREKWRDALEKYRGQMSSWKGQLGGWRSDLRERITDRDEVVGQLKALAPGGSVETEFEDQLATFAEGDGGDGGGDLGGGEEGGETPEGAPTPEQIAAAAREQLDEFQAQRQSLYGEFGSNFVPAGTVPFGSPTQQAAGMANYGVLGASAQGGIQALVAAAKADGATPGGGGVLFQVKQDFAAPPPDPHTWTKSVLFELGAQL